MERFTKLSAPNQIIRTWNHLPIKSSEVETKVTAKRNTAIRSNVSERWSADRLWSQSKILCPEWRMIRNDGMGIEWGTKSPSWDRIEWFRR
mmetsp:Transcript_27630/g.28038  ORF Transcript_27630/g.28038 Transcript_27630/m.28038 type:complete len:91 (+) Transcript_27630:336-608(+)